MIIPALIGLALAGAFIFLYSLCRAGARNESVGRMHLAELKKRNGR